MIIRDAIIAIVVGMILLLALSRFVGGIQFSLSTAFWCSSIAHIVGILVAGLAGWLFAYHISIAVLITLIIVWAFQTALFQVAVRAKRATLQRWRAAILSAIVILGDFFIASPLAALIGQSTK